MKIFHYACSILFGCILAASGLSSCDRLGPDPGSGKMYVSFAKGSELLTKAYLNLPDTSEFLLRISDASGVVVYDGKYGDCPEVLDVKSGSYDVSVVSSEFTKPDFASPQFGDRQCVVVPGNGGSVCVNLLCRQMNAGVRLDLSSAFRISYSDAVLFLKSQHGKLMYSFSEKRTAYFPAGEVSLMMSQGGTDRIIMVRELLPRDMVTLSVTVADEVQHRGGMSIVVDTSRVWMEDACVLGGDGSSGTQADDALSITEAVKSAGREDVWVCGYIVGGDLTSTAASFQTPFKSRTCLLLGPRSSTSDRQSCVSVQLPSGDLRETLNLVDNPELLGRRVCLRGDIVAAYYGLPGIKNITEYNIL